MIIPNTRSDYIILSNNIIRNDSIGSNLYIKTKIIDVPNFELSNNEISNNNYDISWQTILKEVHNNSINYKNRIILSGKIKTNTSSSTSSSSCCLITKNNIRNNMKFIFDSSNNNGYSIGKILFVKNLNINDNSVNYLFDTLNSTNFENSSPTNINNTNIGDFRRYLYHLNYYFNSDSDIYKINMRDYLYKYTDEIKSNSLLYTNTNTNDDLNIITRDISYEIIRYYISNVVNDFSFINTTIDSSSIINFKSSNYSLLLIDNSGGNDFTNTDSVFLNLLSNTEYSIYRNIASYNKLTLDFKHVNYYTFGLNYILNNQTTNINLPNNIIKTFLIKTNNLNTIKNIKSNSKIILGLKNIYLNNIKILDKSSTFYNKTIKFSHNNRSRILKDASNLMFIALNTKSTSITGITQHDIYNHVHFIYNSNQKLTIKIKKNINTTNIQTNSKFTTLIPRLNNYYLLDISLNYTNANNIKSSYNINNTIKYNNVLYNSVTLSTSKVFNLDFDSYFDASTNNYFKNSFNNLAIINNISQPIYTISSELVNLLIYIRLTNLLIDDSSIRLTNTAILQRNLIPKNADDGYDLRFNYNKYFAVSNKLNILLQFSELNVTNRFFLDYYDSIYGLLNFYGLTSESLVKTSSGSDFGNVDCVYIYHDPDSVSTDPRFRYPNNNIEIRYDVPDIDSLSRAIEEYRGTGARTQTTNVAFVPAQNGSNLSRKMIQGIIGLNNIPKLLSILPYDPTSIEGRGFINQYQITDDCITSNCDKIEVKQNAIKHVSVKNNKIFASNSLKKQNFANIVKSNIRNKISQECINNITIRNNIVTLNNTIRPPDPTCNNIIKYTPLTMFRKGKYL